MGRTEWKAATVITPTLPTGSNRWTSGKDQGFTLVEMVLVMIVMTLVAAVTYPAMMRGRSAFHLRTFGRDVIAAVHLARETAVTEQRTMLLQIDEKAQQIMVSDDVGDGARAFSMPGDIKIQVLTHPRGIATATRESGDSEPFRVRFLPNGSSDSVEVLLTAESGATLRIATDPITGSAHVVADQGVKAP